MRTYCKQFWLKTLCVFGILMGFALAPAQAQDDLIKYAEKVYLQTDGDVYTPGSEIWFKAVVLISATHKPTEVSGVLHVNLVDPAGDLVLSQLARISKGIGVGTMHLDPNLPEGTYFLRAYTQWNQNFETDFVFEKKIPIIKSTSGLSVSTDTFQITQEVDGDKRNIKALFPAKSIDSMHRGKLDVVVNLDGSYDTLTVRKKEGDFYMLEYPVKADSDLLSLSYRTNTGKEQFQTVALDTSKIDLQFFAEGGDLIAGIPTRVGFKAIGYDGLSREVYGSIVDADGNDLTTFKSEALGMGSFRLPALTDSLNYFAKVTWNSSDRLIPLPKVKASGSTLSVRKLGAGLQVIALANNDVQNDSVIVNIGSRGQNYFEVKEPMQDGVLSVVFPLSKLPLGIVEVGLFSTEGKKLARRLYFNYKEDQQLQVATDLQKQEYAPREALDLKLQIRDSDQNPKAANAAVLIVDKNQLGAEASYRQNILSYFLLDSELKGHIENPGYYFEDGTYNADAVDNLMLTQGWASYQYDSKVKEPQFLPEPQLFLSGTVNAAFNENRPKDDALVSLMSLNEKLFIQERRTDSLGQFFFNIDGLSGGYQTLLIQTSKDTGKNKDYTLSLNRHKFPKLAVEQQAQFRLLDTAIRKAAQQKVQQDYIFKEALPFGGEDIALDEVVVNSYKMTSNRQTVADNYGMPDVVIDGKDIVAEEEKWSYGLYSVLMFSFPDKIYIDRDKNGLMFAKVNYTEPTLIVVDGEPVRSWEYQLLPYMPVREIESFEIIEGAKNFSTLYRDVYPDVDAMKIPIWGHVIAIYTYAGKGVISAKHTKGILTERVQVFTEPEEFYTPKYKTQADLADVTPDLRSTLFWEPNLQVDETGNAEIHFYNPDNTGTMLILVETVSQEGELGYKMTSYTITDRDDP